MNTEKIVRYPSIPEEERRLSEDLIYNRGEDPVAAFANYFKAKGAAPKVPKVRPGTPLERLPQYILDGSKEGLIDDLEAVRTGGMAPLEVINGPLMDGMREVGRLFNANELIVAEVLQSAEAMKAAVSHLEKFMEKAGGSRKGKVILATVKGDVHDIGKNLVEIILSNNGYEVVNLGIKCPPEKLVEAYQTHAPDLIGLSGLLVKSAQQMVTTAQDLTAAGVTAPLLVGGAALSQKFTDHRIAPAYGGLAVYAEDAMRGLALADRILSSEEARQALAAESEKRRAAIRWTSGPMQEIPLSAPAVRSPEVAVVEGMPAPTAEESVLSELDLEEVWKYLNPHMLYAKHLGLRGSYRKLKEAGDPKLAELEAVIARVQAAGWIRARAIYRYFGASSEGNTLSVAVPGGGEACFTFPSQVAGERLCLADFVHPHLNGATPQASDSVAMFITTAGEGVRAKAEELKNAGRVPSLPRPPGARRGDRRGRRGVAAREASRGVGISGSARDDDARPVPGAISRQALQLRLPGLPRPRGSVDALPAPRREQDRRRADGRVHDGPRGLGLGARSPPPAGPLLRRLDRGQPPLPPRVAGERGRS